MAKFNKDSVGGTLTVVVLLSLICSLIVAGAAVMLKPTQDIQKQLDKQKNILQAAGLLQKIPMCKKPIPNLLSRKLSI